MKPSLFLLSASTIIAFLGITSCAPRSQERDITSKDSDSNKILAPGENSKTTAFLHEKEIDTYLTSVKGFLLEMPTNGKFGKSRLDPFVNHATKTTQVKGYDEVQRLTNDFTIRTFVIGSKKPILKRSDRTVTIHLRPPIPKLDSSSVRLSEALADQYKSFLTMSLNFDPRVPFEPEIVGAVLRLKPMLDEKGYDTYSEPIKVNGVMGNLLVKAVRAPSNECLSCHTNIKPGQPIGYAMATIWKK